MADNKTLFLMDAALFREAMSHLEIYGETLKVIHTAIETDPEIQESELEELEMQIDMIDVIISNFRYAIHKTIIGSGPNSSFH